MLDSSIYRHAAYFAPDQDQLLAELGARWLGRCALTRRTLTAPSFDGISATSFRHYTAAASRYGWHATMKAPFARKAGLERDAIPATFATLALAHKPISLAPLALRNMGDYLALVPSDSSQTLQDFAYQCVRALHPLAEPLTADQLAHRRLTPLTRRQDELLSQWAYPYVADQFQWHMTLSGSLQALPDDAQQRLYMAALKWFEPVLNRPLTLDAISWFIEPEAGGDFYQAQRFPLGAP